MEQAQTLETLKLELADLHQSVELAEFLADQAAPGTCVFLAGPVGAGKTTLARATILSLLARENNEEDVPSPTFTLVQTYWAGTLEIWHADLYRLTDPNELFEIGLEEALDSAFCLVEWPDRLPPDMTAARTVRIWLQPGPTENSRIAEISGDKGFLEALQNRASTWD